MAATAHSTVKPFPRERRPVPFNRPKTIKKAVEAGRVADVNPSVRKRQRAAYDAALAELTATDFLLRMVETLAYCVPDEGRAKFAELARLSVQPAHSPEYKRAAAKFLRWFP